MQLTERRRVFFCFILAGICYLSTFSALATEQSLVFTGNNAEYVNTGVRVTTQDFTFEAWIRPSAFVTESRVAGQYLSGGNGRMCISIWQKQLGLFVGGDVNQKVLFPDALEKNTWYHVAVVRAGTSWRFYLNGVRRLESTNHSNLLFSNTNFILGNISTSPGWNSFYGGICDVRLWSKARSDTEISQNYNVRLAAGETGLLGYWPMLEGNGASTANMASGVSGATINLATWRAFTDLTLPDHSASVSRFWNAASGDWSTPMNWENGIVPNGRNEVACFTNTPAASVEVNNDMSGLTLGALQLDSPSAFTISGQPLSFDTSAAAVSLTTRDGTTQTVACAVSATNNLIVNNILGGGTVVLTGVNTGLSGGVTLARGTLRVPGSDALGTGETTIGSGTLHITGTGVTMHDLFLDAVANNRASTLVNDGDVTITGRIQNRMGSFIKRGAGTLTLNGAVRHVFSTLSGFPTLTRLDLPANGDSPTQGFSALNIAEGRLVLDAPGSTNVINSRCVVGMWTTETGEEKAGVLEIRNGRLQVNSSFLLGYNNGNTVTAPEGLTSSVLVSGGELIIRESTLSLGGSNLKSSTYTGRPLLRQTGGLIEMGESMPIAEGSGKGKSTVEISGGLCRINSENSKYYFTCLRLGNSGEGEMILSGTGEFYGNPANNPAQLGVNSTGTGILRLNGGRMTAGNIVRGYGRGTVYFNGGVFRPLGTGTLNGLTAAYVGEGHVVLDTSLSDFTIAQKLEPDGASAGGLVKLGTNTLYWTSTGSTYRGATVVSGGVFRAQANLPGSGAVVESGAELRMESTNTVSAVTVRAGGILGIAPMAVQSYGDIVFETGAKIALYADDNDTPLSANGTYDLLKYTGTDPDVSTLSVVAPIYGKQYQFTAADGVIQVTISLDSDSASVWGRNGSGAWSDTGNWIIAPQAGAPVRFDNIPEMPVTVTTAGETTGDIFFHSAFSYTLEGTGLTLDNAGSDVTTLTVESGSHSITAPLTLNKNTQIAIDPGSKLAVKNVTGAVDLSAKGEGTLGITDDLSVNSLHAAVSVVALAGGTKITVPVVLERNPITLLSTTNGATEISGVISGNARIFSNGGGVLKLTGMNTFTEGILLSDGTTEFDSLADLGEPCSAGIGNTNNVRYMFNILDATLRYTGPSVTVNRAFNIDSVNKRASIFHTENDVTLSGEINADSGALIKSGPGTLRLINSMTNELGKSDASNVHTYQNISPYGDGPTQGFASLTVNNGTLALGSPEQVGNDDAQVFCVADNNRIMVGAGSSSDPSKETAGKLVLDSGTLKMSRASFGIGWNNGTNGLRSEFIINNGRFLAQNGCAFSLGVNLGNLPGYRTRPRFAQYGGYAEVGWISSSETPGSDVTMDFFGGEFKTTSLIDNLWGIIVAKVGTGTMNLYSNVQVNAAYRVVLALNGAATGNLNLYGGRLSCINIVKGSGTGHLRFDGGTLCINGTSDNWAMGGGIDQIWISTNGAVLEATARAWSSANVFTPDPEMDDGAKDGGITKIGTNAVYLTELTSPYRGPVTVKEGLLRAPFIRTNDLAVAAGATFDEGGLSTVIGTLSGLGQVINGTAVLAGRLSAGTNGVVEGASLSVENLSFLPGATLDARFTGAPEAPTNNPVTVEKTLTGCRGCVIDFGRTEENLLPIPFEMTLMRYNTLAAGFSHCRAINTGLPGTSNVNVSLQAKDGVVKVVLRYGSMLILLK